MATGKNIRTWFEGRWHDGDVMIMRAADHGSWLGTTVFDGARWFEGMAPDLEPHCERVNRSARALGITPSMDTGEIVEIVREGLRSYGPDRAVYIRPMYWGIHGGEFGVDVLPGVTGFCVCLEEIPMAAPLTPTTLTSTRFRRPVLADAVVDAKAGCLYPNNARMLQEARQKGFANALVLDALGNVAEAATANVFMVRDGAVMTPVANGTFLAGITRARTIGLLRDDGHEVIETVLTYDDFRRADEVFLTGNFQKVTPVVRFEDSDYQVGPVTRRARELYWEWARATEG